ncbi:18522_t:CDS:2 [Funneliformis geosporum]|nr:18522_t:CDS:2 [Funneliformis geosporum]
MKKYGFCTQFDKSIVESPEIQAFVVYSIENDDTLVVIETGGKTQT